MVPGQRRAGEVVEAPSAGLAAIALPVRLRVVAPVADYPITATPGTAHALGPAKLAHQREAPGVIQQPREVDQIRCRHDHQGSLREGSSRLTAPIITSKAPCDRYPLPRPSTPRNPRRASSDCATACPARIGPASTGVSRLGSTHAIGAKVIPPVSGRLIWAGSRSCPASLSAPLRSNAPACATPPETKPAKKSSARRCLARLERTDQPAGHRA